MSAQREQAWIWEVRPLLTVALPSEPTAPRRAREALEDLPPYLNEQLAKLRLIVTELVTNSVRHAGLSPADQIEITILERGEQIRVEVRDPGAGYEATSEMLHHLPSERTPDQPLPEGGFGLLVVASLADRVGARWDGGTVVWTELGGTARDTESGASGPKY